MSFKDFLLKGAFALEKKQDPIYTFDVCKQERYVSSFPNPQDDIDRSFCQYKCQMKLYGVFVSFALNLISFPLTLHYLARYQKTKVQFQKKYDAVFFRDGKPANIMPIELRNEYLSIIEDPEEGNMLTKSDVSYIKAIIKRHPLSWHLSLKVLIKVARYRYAIVQYNPSAFIVCNEYSFTSSALTEYCHHNSMKHINVMHGEKFFFMRDSFYHFDRSYVWDEYYAKLSTELRADPSQFCIAQPPSLLMEGEYEKKYDYSYYLASESDNQIQKISDALQRLKEKGFSVKIRPHPRYSDPEKMKAIFDNFEIEDTRSIPIEQSVLESRSVIAVFSTVLQQAYLNGVEVVIDDVSDTTRFKKLKEIRFIMLERQHQLLSELI